MGAAPDGPTQQPGGSPPLVGRAREQAALRDTLDAALAGHGALVLIGGEAGIGKTALAEWLLAEAAAAGALVLVGRCYDLSETPPYGPWAEALARAPVRDDLPAAPDLAAGGGATSQAALFAVLRDALAARAARQPLVLLLDDLQWADPASLDVLRVVARGLAALPLLLLATYRADELTRRHPLYPLLPALVREARATRLDLRGLGDAAVQALVAARYGLADADAARLVAYLQGRGEGNALFLGELLRALEEAGALHPAGAGWALGDLAGRAVPALLRQVLDGRLARLGAAAEELLTLAAVIGQVVPLALWATVAATDEEGLLDTIDRAGAAHLIAVAPDGGAVRFAHALIREALYEALVATRRRRVHRRVGEALVATPDPDPDTIAHHFRQAGDPRAADWLVRAGERAQAAYAWPTAAARFEAALALLDAADADAGRRGWLLYRVARLRRTTEPAACIAYLDEAARLAAAAGDAALAAGVLFTRGACRGFLDDYARAIPDLVAGVAAIEALAPEARARLNAHSDVGDFAFVRGTLAPHLAASGRLAEAAAVGERFLAEHPAPGAGNARWGSAYVDAYFGLFGNYSLLGKVAAAREIAARASALFRERGDYYQLGLLTTQGVGRFLLVPYATDRVADRRALAAEALGIWRRVGGLADAEAAYLAAEPFLRLDGRWDELQAPFLRARARSYLFHFAPMEQALLARERGDAAGAWATIRLLLPEGPHTPHGATRFMTRMPLVQLAVVLACDADDLAEARAWLAAHDRWLAGSGTVLWRAEGQALWARYYRQAGDLALARERAERALAHAAVPRQPLALLAAHRLLGELDTSASRHGDAAVHLADALALAEACAAPYERALTLLALAELHLATNDRDGAWSALEEARARLTPLEARPALARADHLAAALAAPAAPAPPAHPAGLSTREVEVLRLVARGLTNAQAAERLFLSPRTVDQHLRSIYNKLGVENRAAAARWAAEHNLTGGER